jgi:hypothetical protein
VALVEDGFVRHEYCLLDETFVRVELSKEQNFEPKDIWPEVVL